MKVIFLDIDGVLNNKNSISKNVHIDPRCSVLIGRLCKECNAKIVISSSWRILKDFRFIRDHLDLCGIDSRFIIGKTPVFPNLNRGNEIKEWIKWSCEEDLEQFVIIDDDNDFCDDQLNNFVQTSFDEGFTIKDFEKAKFILMN